MPQKDPNRTEKATPRRRDKVRREEGRVPRSEEVSKVVVLLAGIIGLRVLIKFMCENIFDVFRFIMSSFKMEITKNSTYYLLLYCMKKLLIIILPIVLLIAIMSVIAIRLQIGKIVLTKILKPIWGRFNIVNNLKNQFFSLNTGVEIIKSSFQVGLVGTLAYFTVKNQIKYLPSLFFFKISLLLHQICYFSFIKLHGF